MKYLVLAVLLFPANLAFAQEATYDASAPSLAEMAQQEAYAGTYQQPAPAYVAPAPVEAAPAPVYQQPHPQVNPVEMFYYAPPAESYSSGNEIAPISNLNF